MKLIHSRAHGALDYVLGVLLIVAPTVLGFAEGPERWVPVCLGIAAILYSLLTDYELGVVRLLPFRVHLVVDAFHGVFLALSPWLFGFAERVYLPHLLLGVAELAVVMLSVPEVDTARRSASVRMR